MLFPRRKPLSARRTKAILRSRATAEILETRALLAVFTVTTDQDSQPGNPSISGSLRWAIEQANADPAFDTIAFNIATLPGQTDVTIHPNYALPAITQTAKIDGVTQTSAHMLGRPVVEIRGRSDEPSAVVDDHGLRVMGDNVEIAGLAITRFTGAGIYVTGSGARIYGNYIGTALTGDSDLGNFGSGIVIASTTSAVLPSEIGTSLIPAPGAGTFPGRNVISGNSGDGIRIDNTPEVTISNNYVGTTAAGTSTPGAVIGNDGDGIRIGGARSYAIEIKAGLAGANVVGGNLGNGIHVLPNTPSVTISENIIGLSADGLSRASNEQNGLLLEGFNANVQNNTVSGNQGNGVLIKGQADPEGLLDGLNGWVTGDSLETELPIYYDDRGNYQNVALVPAVVGRGLRFNGVDSAAFIVGTTAKVFEPTGCIEFWASFNSLSGEQVLADNLLEQTDGTISGWSFYKAADNSLRLVVTGGDVLSTAPGIVQADRFYHMAVTRNSLGEVSIYLNGLQVAATTLNSSTSWFTYSSRLKLGYRAPIGNNNDDNFDPNSVRATRRLNGIIDEFTLYTDALSPQRVAQIHTRGSLGKPKPAMANTLSGGRIGTNLTGTVGLGNQQDGIRLTGDTRSTAIGLVVSSGNAGSGVKIDITPHSESLPSRRASIWGTSISGLNAGLSEDRQSAIPNQTGLNLQRDYKGVIVGFNSNLGPEFLPTFSGNLHDGVLIGPFFEDVQLMHAMVGLNLDGSRGLGNGRDGVHVEAVNPDVRLRQIQIGSSVISANGRNGVYFETDGLDFEAQQAGRFSSVGFFNNFIGTDATGSRGIGNGVSGIHLRRNSTSEGASSIQLVENLVSGNGIGVSIDQGVAIDYFGFTRNKIGTDSTGKFVLPNQVGLRIFDALSFGMADDNVIGGNSLVGVDVIFSSSVVQSHVSVSGTIGTDIDGEAALPNGTGVSVQFEPSDYDDSSVRRYLSVSIGNAVISGNRNYGVHIRGEGRGGVLASYDSIGTSLGISKIGTDRSGRLAIPNGLGGVLVESDVQFSMAGNVIAYNAGPGVRYQGNSLGWSLSAVGSIQNGGDYYSGNRFFGNTGLAIDLGVVGPSKGLDVDPDFPHAPKLTSARIVDGFVEIAGENVVFPGGWPSPLGGLQFYATRPTTDGLGQGEILLGLTALSDGTGSNTNISGYAGGWIIDPYRDFDARNDHFLFRIPVTDGFSSGTLLTAANVYSPYSPELIGTAFASPISEFSNIIPIGSVLSSLAPLVDAGGSVQLFAGDTLSRTVSFRDEDSNAFEILVDYGDGTGKQPLEYRRDNRTMLLDHVYQKAGAYTVTVSVLDDSTPVGRLGTDSFQVVVQNTPPEIAFNEVQLTKRIREGETVDLAGSFADLGANDAHTIEVDWGDGTLVTPESIAVGARSFALSHCYDDDGVSRADAHVYRVVVTVRDQFGAASATPVFLVEVDNVVPSGLQLALDQTTIHEGGTAILNGRFVDPGLLDTHLVYVNWGDGSPKEKVPLDQIAQTGSLREFSLQHTYVDNPVDGSPYTITVEVADDDDPLNPVSSTLQIAVNNLLPYFIETGVGQPPIILSDDVINEGDSVAAFAYFLDQGTEQHTARVNWGDGTPETVLELPASGSPFFLPFLNHRYDQNGLFAITITVSDRDTPPGSDAVTSKLITVRNVAPTVLPISVSPTGLIKEGDEVSVAGFFTDPATDEPYVVSVNWGDGTSSPAEVDRTTRSYTAKHRYLDDPTVANDQYSITVSVNDGIQTGTRTTPIVVRNVAPTLSVLPIVDTSTNNAVFRAEAFDVSPLDQAGLVYSWTLTKNGVNVPFVSRSVTEIAIDPATIPAGSAPLILTTTVDDVDGGVTSTSMVLIIGTNGADSLTITNSSFPTGYTDVLVLGLGGNDFLDASGITASGLHVALYGGEGDDLLFDGAGSDTAILGWGNDSLNLPVSDPRNTTGIVANMGGDDVVYLIPNSVLTAYDSVGHNTLNFSLADSGITQANGITFDLELTQRSAIVAQDVAPGSVQPNQHFVAALGTFDTLVGSNYADMLTGASNSAVFGGLGNDNFYTKDDVTDATFSGGADADVLTARGVRVARISFKGDDGIDELRIDDFAEVLDNLDFDGGNDADLMVNRGKVARIVFKGGADADVLQNVKGRISKISFKGDDGIDQLINEEFASIEWQAGDDPTLQTEQGIDFDGGSDADILINRGKVSRIVFKGGADADVLQNQKGRVSKISFKGDDGIDRLINEEFASVEWQVGDDPSLQAEQGIDFEGGSDADVLTNRGRVSRVVFKGGADADVLQNQRGRITKISFKGDDGADRYINEEDASVAWQAGDDPSLQAEEGIDFDGGNDADILINRGRVSRVVFRGGADADVLQNQKGRITKISFKGDDGADSFINEEDALVEWQVGDDPTLQAEQGIDFDGGNDADILINRGRVSRVVFKGGADADVLQNQKGRVTKISFKGDDGADTFINEEFATIEWQTGDDPDLQTEQGIDFDGGNDADILINRGRVSRIVFKGGADADVLQNKKGRVTKISFKGDDGADTFVNETNATVGWETGDDASLQADQGIDFDGGNDADVLINRGRVSRVVFRGGADSDLLDLQSGEATDDVLFEGGDDADVLVARSRVRRIRFDGDAGDDAFLITGTIAGDGPDGGLVEFNGGDDADVLVSRGTLRRLVFRGGADDNADDVLQTSGGSIEELDFLNESGAGILVNRTNGIGALTFTGGNEADMFINRGQNIGNITFVGGGGDDVFVNSGSTNPSSPGILTFDAGDGSNAMRNEGTGWTQVIYTGGLGEDFLQNNGTGIGSLSFDGGNGANALENNASGISNIAVEGSNDNDIFANDGDNVSGIVFHALNGINTLINTGSNVSGVEYRGGNDADRFVNSGFALKNSTFYAEAGDDRFFNYGASTENVTMIGDAGADWWINQASAVGSKQLRFEAGGDEAADVFINWAANLSNVIVDGGAGDDLLQNGGLNSSNVQFNAGTGNDLLLNLGYGADQFTFNAGDGDDVFENRGRNGGTLRMLGGAGDDAFYQNAGFAADIELDGSDGNDTVLNFSSNMGRIALIGGAGDDILQNSGDDVGSLELTGGAGKNTLQNFGNRIDAIRVLGSGVFVSSFDSLLNSGSSIALIQMTSDVTATLLSSGSEIAVVSVIGSGFNDVVRVSGNNLGSIVFDGKIGDDSLLIDTQSSQSSSIVYHGDAGDDLFLFRGFTNSVQFDGGIGNDQVVFAGHVSSATLRGNTGNDLYRFANFPTGSLTVDEDYSRTLMVDDLSSDTLDFSSYRTGAISLDLAITTPQLQWYYFVPLVFTLTNQRGIENVVGTDKADSFLGNSRNNVLTGAQYLPTGSTGEAPVAFTKTQWVYLDFFGSNDAGEHVYSEAEALEVKRRMELAYAGFDVRVVLNVSDLPINIAGDSAKYVTIHFNQTPSTGRPGGESSAIDFGNVDPGGTATVQVNGLLGGREVLDSGLKAVAAESADKDSIQAPDIAKPESSVENFIALSAKIATHELAHLLGVRHYDAFGPVGFGINSPPGSDRFKPTFSGIAGAFETADHMLSSPASAGTDRFNDLRSLYFGEREAIKLALAFSDQARVRVQEAAGAHATQATASHLNLVTLSVPNLATGGLSKDKSFSVQATSVVGSIGLASNGKSQNDWYSFAGNAGDIVTIEVMSRALKRYYESNATSIDSVVRLYNAAGQLVQTFGADAVNDDEFESSDSLLMDVTLPAGGTYFIEVDTFRRLPGDANYDAAVALRAQLAARNNLTTDETQLLQRLIDSLNDTDTGNYELLIYRSSSANASDGIDDIQGRAGVDEIDGGQGDDYSLGLQVTGSASTNQGSVWNGSTVFTDRGGFSWTATINYGDGSTPVTWSPTASNRNQQLSLSHVYLTSGQRAITVNFANDDGLTTTKIFTVQVNHVDPTVSLTGPAAGVTGTSLVYNVSATDATGATNTLTCSWTIIRNGATFATQSGGLSYSLNAALPGTYIVSVTVNDGSGGIVTKSISAAVTGGVVSFDVASGLTQRSWIDALDVVFASQQLAADLMANPTRIKLTKFGLDGPTATDTGTSINFGGAAALSRNGANLKLNFGANVIGTAGQNSTAADGYYRLDLDFDGNGTIDAVEYFYRLLGDVNGDRKVDATDANLILAGMSKPFSRELDINGDMVVNNTDRGWTQRSNGRKLKDGLFLND